MLQEEAKKYSLCTHTFLLLTEWKYRKQSLFNYNFNKLFTKLAASMSRRSALFHYNLYVVLVWHFT